MLKTIHATNDCTMLHPEEPADLEPGTYLRLTIFCRPLAHLSWKVHPIGQPISRIVTLQKHDLIEALTTDRHFGQLASKRSCKRDYGYN